MNVFVIHKSDDLPVVDEITEHLTKDDPSSHLLVLKGSDSKNKDAWKKEAKKKIKDSNCVLIINGEKTAYSNNVQFEINYALKKHKEIFLFQLNSHNDIYNKLYAYDEFMKVKHHQQCDIKKCRPLFKSIEGVKNENNNYILNDLKRIIKNNYDFDIIDELKLNDIADSDAKMTNLLEQYKIYLGTSEEVITRRQTASSFYTSINTSLITVAITASGLIFSLSNMSNQNVFVGVILFIISLLGILICINWMLILESYGKLNSAKIKVISAIEKKLPADIYDTEWRVMSEKIGTKKYKSFTYIEKKLPIIFMLLYSILLLLGIILFVIDLIY